MSHLSIRKLPPELDKAIRREARRRNTSKSKIVIEALTAAFMLQEPAQKAQRDVRRFFGRMSVGEYKELQKAMHEFSSIDEEMWK